MKKLWYLLVLLPVVLIAAASPEIKNYTFHYETDILRGDTTTGETAATAIVSDQSDSVKILTIDCAKWDKVWIRVKTHEYYSDTNVQFGTGTDDADLYGVILYAVVNADAAVSPTTGKPISALEDNPLDTAFKVYDFSKFYYNVSDTTKFIPEIQIWAKGWGDTLFFLTPMDSTDKSDSIATINYDFEITVIKK